MADIKTSVLTIGSNNLILQDAAVRASIAPEYSSSSTYAVGDLCMNNGVLYECNTAISTAEAWTAAHWTAVTVGGELGSLKDGLDELYSSDGDITDEYNGNVQVAGMYPSNSLTNTWDSSSKTLGVAMVAQSSSAATYYTYLSPKLKAGHTYKIPIKYTFSFSYTYIYIRNIFSLSNYNNRDDIVNGATIYSGDENVLTVTATQDGWLAFGVRISANSQQTWSFKLALYDITDADVSGITNDQWLEFPNSISMGTSGIVAEMQASVNAMTAVSTNVKGETWSALGDSLTATGSGGYYLDFTKNKLGLSLYKNCGIGGTFVSGAEASSAMYQDTRIESLDINSNCVTVLGGTNDCWQEYYKDHPGTNLSGWGAVTRDNHDVSTFVGAYNVMISKILYKFCKVNGYYSDVSYSGITQVSTATENFRLILLTPPQRYYSDFSHTLSKALTDTGITAVHNYVKQIAELWGLPCVDTWEMGMNDMNKALFFANPTADATHFNSFGHERLASLLINKAIQISRYK